MTALPLIKTDRLTLSRERLRMALRDQENETGKAQTSSSGSGSSGIWLKGLKKIPGADVVIEAVSSWWAQHPLRMVGVVASDAAKVVVQPMAQRHPFSLVFGVLILGGLFTWSRPWRWILKPALFAGLMPQLLSKALAHIPVHKWMLVLAALNEKPRTPSSRQVNSIQQAAQQAEDIRREQHSPY